MKAVVRPIRLPDQGRTLVISDVHGNLPWLKALLDKAAFGRADALVLAGDLVEKGAESLATLRWVMDLARTHTVYALSGNCDRLALEVVDGSQQMDRDFFRFYLKTWGRRALVAQMAAEAGLSIDSPEELPGAAEQLGRQFAPELEFLRGLPTILTAPGFTFVHGGVPSFHRMEELDAWQCMKNDDFMSQGHSFPHYCVVGHWPVTLYREDFPCCAPIIDRQRKIISIDGGCVLKPDGQLNALVIQGGGAQELSWISYDDYPQVVALDGQEASRDPVILHWTDHHVELLERGAEFSLVRAGGRPLWVLSKYLREREGSCWCEDSTDYRLPVAPGDRLSVIEETSRGYLVKKQGVTGWYHGRTEACRG